MSRRQVTPESPLNQRIVAALQSRGPMHAYDLAPIVHATRKTLATRDYLPLLVRSGLIHIRSWARLRDLMLAGEIVATRGQPIAIYAAGPGKTPPKPRPYTDAENSRNQRQRNTGRAFRHRIKRHGLAAADPLLAALMGINNHAR